MTTQFMEEPEPDRCIVRRVNLASNNVAFLIRQEPGWKSGHRDEATVFDTEDEARIAIDEHRRQYQQNSYTYTLVNV